MIFHNSTGTQKTKNPNTMDNSKSRKSFTLVEIIIVVVIVGLLTAIAIPALQKVHQESREKAITGNLRQVALAGAQYMLETGDSQVAYTALIPIYFNAITAIAGESYTNMTISKDGGILTVITGGGQSISFMY